MGRRKNPYSSLTVKNTKSLHKDIESQYIHMGEAELLSTYSEKKQRHEELGEYTKLSKDQAEEYKDYQRKRSNLERDLKNSRSDAINSLSAFAFAKSIFSEREKSAAELAAVNQIETHKRNAPKFADYSEEISERKSLYHELIVLRALIKKFNDERIKALAKKATNKSRDGSSTIKRRQLQTNTSDITCPYCEEEIAAYEAVLDHIYPIALGGLTTQSNTVLICNPCNRSKGKTTLILFCKKNKFHYSDVIDRLLDLGKSV
jgi:5-methylcytosine-specific restriction endonuclease McrA